MKTIFRIFVFLFLVNSVNAQIVNIPDANFKAKLLSASPSNQIASTQTSTNAYGNVTTYNTIDINGDGEIQESEAIMIKYLNVSSSSINSIDGINSFVNLQVLWCQNNQITSTNLALGNLQGLFFSSNQLVNIDLSGLTNLESLSLDNNRINSLDISMLANLKLLFCQQGLGVPFQYLLNNLNINGLVNLETLYIRGNALSNLNLNGLTNLIGLDIRNNLFSNINLSTLTNLNVLFCESNQLTSLDLSGLNNLEQLYCQSNALTSLDVSGLTNLIRLDCSTNLITNLDVSNLTNLELLYCYANQLIALNIKNNKKFLPANPGDNFVFSSNSNLSYICSDEAEIELVQNKINAYGYSATCHVNSYCTFNPGGYYNTITGTTTFDSDNNGCDVTDLPKPNIKININDGTNQGATFTNNAGNYNFYTQAGSFTLTPNIENPSWFTFSPSTATIPFADNNNNISEQNFCISPNGIHNDLEVVIAPLTPARPGFDATYEIIFKNKGNQTLSGNVSLTFDDDKTDFVLAVPNPDNLALNSLSWNYTNLLPFESRTINVTLNVNSPQETPAVNIGDQLDFVVAINPVVNDEIPLDNSFSYKQIVVGSFDPNNIECLEGEVVAPSYIGQYLHYAVNFENTGNYPAENIVVKIVIDTTKYDIDSLQLLNVSHNSYTRITGNIVEVIFQQISLDSGGHGNLLFKIRTNDNLVEGNAVAKRADIFFDYNAPIDTGMVNTTFQALNNSVFELDNSISIYPNPTNGKVNINVNDNINNTIKSVELYDVQGRLVQMQLLDEVQTSIDISEKSNGIYFLKITSDKGSKVEKLIKE